MRFLFIILFFIVVSCNNKPINPIEQVMVSDNPKIKTVVDSLENHEVQILFTEVKKTKDSTYFKDYSFQVDDSTYFYPASTVKFPVALLALEKMNRNPAINRNTIFKVDSDSLKTTFAKDINILFAVSDNYAYTRLFEYLGQDYITNQLKSRGITSRISHRFSGNNPYSLTNKPLHFYKNDNVIYTTDSIKNKPIEPLKLNKIIKGVGHIKNDSLINEPLDFSLKNYIPISSLHNVMKQFMFPELYPEEKRFNISEDDKQFLLKAMKLLPKEAGYTTDEYYDSYVKLFVFGDSKEDIPDTISIYNKVGFAYGYLTDCAYIINHKTNKEYIITATVHVNKNKVYNDGVYEYETVGIPFLAELGRQLID